MKITQAFIDSIYEALEETVIDASNAIIEVYKSESFNTEIKSDGSPVTEADNKANDVITKALNKITTLKFKNLFNLLKLISWFKN